MEQLKIKDYEVEFLSQEELKKNYGGRGSWLDVFWMTFRDICEAYVKACNGAQGWLEKNHEYSGGRSFNR